MYLVLLRTPAFCLVALCVFAQTAHAQERRAQSCFQRPSPDCAGFVLTQIGIGTHLGSLYHGNSPVTSRFIVTVVGGYMVNVDSKNALGGALFFGANDVDGWVGVQGRYRRWFGQRLSLDVGLGVARTGRSLPSPMLMGETGINFGDRAAVFLQLQTVGNREWFSRREGAAFDNTYVAPSITVRLRDRWASGLAIGLTAFVGLLWAAL